MTDQAYRTAVVLALFFVAGAILACEGLLTIGSAGDGTAFFLLVYSSPGGLAWGTGGLLVFTPLLWLTLGVLCRAERYVSGWLAGAILAVHYVGIPITLWKRWESVGKWTDIAEQVRLNTVHVTIGATVYMAMHAAALWMLLYKKR